MSATTFLLGFGEPGGDLASRAGLPVGARLQLRRCRRAMPALGGKRSIVAVHAPDGRPLGYLPADDARMVGDLLDAGIPADAKISAVVPGFRRERVQLVIEVGHPAGGPAQPAA